MENSYSTIVKEITDKIRTAKAQTLSGTEFLKNMYQTLNESSNITPMLSLKPFVTGAEKISGDDATIGEIISFIKKRTTGGDLNFIINLAKEEHFAELKRAGHPDPKDTIKDIKDSFDKPASVIEEGVRNGIFDGLKSKLLNQVKVDLTNTTKPLNEGLAQLNINTVKYNPIGVKLEVAKEDRIVFLTESDVLNFDRVTKQFSKLTESEFEIPNGHRLLMTAITTAPYNPEKNSFSLNENWDMKLELSSEGKILLNGTKEIPKKDIQKLLFESVEAYTLNPGLVNSMGINRDNYFADADRFITLCENHDKLIKIDNLTVIKNLSESTYIMFDKNSKVPTILSSSDKNIVNYLFESYNSLVNTAKNIMGVNLTPLFESQLASESIKISERNNKIVSLNEEQKSLNEQILKVKNLQGLAEPDSPALDKLNEQYGILDNALQENLKQLNTWKNEFKLY